MWRKVRYAVPASTTSSKSLALLLMIFCSMSEPHDCPIAASGRPGLSRRIISVKCLMPRYGRAQPARAELAKARRIATVLGETRRSVAAMIVGVDRVARGDELLGKRLVAQRVLAETVGYLHDAFRR